MLRVHRNTIYILTPICVASIILSFVLNLLAIQTCGATSSWYTYGCNLAIGVFGSSLLSLALAGIGYCRERRSVLEEYYKCIDQMVIDISQYRRCMIKDQVQCEKNMSMLSSVVGSQLRHLGDTFSQVAFIWDRYDVKKYLYEFYLFFEDIRVLTKFERRIYAEKGISRDIISSIDAVLIKIKDTPEGTYYCNVADLEEEENILIDLANGRFKKNGKLSFCKTVIDDRFFQVEDSKTEAVLKDIVETAKETKSMTLDASSFDDIPLEYLYKYRYIISTSVDKSGKLVKIEISDKAYYYFIFKEHYEKSKQAEKETSLCKHI